MTQAVTTATTRATAALLAVIARAKGADPLDSAFALGLTLLYVGTVQSFGYGTANMVAGSVLIGVPLLLVHFANRRKE